MRLWRRVVESRWAETLASNLGVPSGRRQQEALDMERLALSTQLWAARADAQAKGSAPPTQLDYQRIAMRVRRRAHGPAPASGKHPWRHPPEDQHSSAAMCVRGGAGERHVAI